MTRNEEIFSDYFRHWGISLPEEVVHCRQRGEIQSHGWHLQCLFGKDDHGEYLDFYASHRIPTIDFITGKRTNRLYTRVKVIDMFFFRSRQYP
jgi:hypothetical protein